MSSMATVASVGCMLALPSPALADGGAFSADYAAEADFTSYGEHATVWDRAADGHSAVGEYDLIAGPSWSRFDTVWNTKGFSYTDPATRNYAIGENRQIRYRACIGEYSTKKIWNCGPWYYDHT